MPFVVTVEDFIQDAAGETRASLRSAVVRHLHDSLPLAAFCRLLLLQKEDAPFSSFALVLMSGEKSAHTTTVCTDTFICISAFNM